MTDPALPTPSPPSEAPVERARVGGPAQRKLDGLPLLYVAGAAVLGLALLYLYTNPLQPAVNQAEVLKPQVEALTARIAQLEGRIPNIAPAEGRIAALEGRLAQVETRPAPTPPDLQPLSARLDAAATRQDLAALAARVDAAATKQDLGPVAARAEAAAPRTDVAALASRVDNAAPKSDVVALAALLAAAEARAAQSDQATRAAALQAVAQASAQLEAQVSTRLAALAASSSRLSRLQSAAVALDAGQKLGEVPGAPPAVARFANEAPPTEASLRLSFDAAADAARRAAEAPLTDSQPLVARMWTRAQQTVTVRQGDQVVVGNPVSGPLTRAKQSVDAGDLQGAVAALGSLSGAAAAAVKPWVEQAQALLDARAALAQMARG